VGVQFHEWQIFAIGSREETDNGIPIAAFITFQFPKTVVGRTATVVVHFLNFLDKFLSQGAKLGLFFKVCERHLDTSDCLDLGDLLG
jgi:hypothetical protein